jgi:hypothetical protein
MFWLDRFVFVDELIWIRTVSSGMFAVGLTSAKNLMTLPAESGSASWAFDVVAPSVLFDVVTTCTSPHDALLNELSELNFVSAHARVGGGGIVVVVVITNGVRER